MAVFKSFQFFSIALLLSSSFQLLNVFFFSGVRLGYARAESIEQFSAVQLFEKGLEHYRHNRFREALASWRQARIKYYELNDYHAVSVTLSMMVVSHIAIGEYSEAIQRSEPAFQLAKNAQDIDLQVQILGNLGIAYEGAGQYALALNTYQQALEKVKLLSEDLKSIKHSHILGLAGNTYSSLGKYEQSIATYQESLEISENINDTIGLVATYGNLGVTYFQIGETNLALENFKKSLHLAKMLDNPPDIAYVLNNMSSIYRNQGDLPLALESGYQSLEIAKAGAIPELEVEALTNIGLIYEELDDIRQAIDYYRQGLAKAHLLQNPEMTAMALNNLGHGLYNAGNLTEAETHLQEAIEHLESLRTSLNDSHNISLLDTQIFTYNLLQQVLVAQEDYEPALEISEAGRARALADLLKSRTAFSISRTPSAVNGAVSDSPVSETLSIENIKAIAREQNAVLVEYALVPEDAFRVQGRQRGNVSEIHIWVVHPNGIVNFYSQPANIQALQLKELVNQMRDSLGRSQSLDRGLANANLANSLKTSEKLKELYTMLIAPIKDVLPSDPERKVVFIPQEELFFVPFPALQDESGTYLIEEHTVLTAPSIQTLGLTRKKKEFLSTTSLQDFREPLIVGNPDMPEVLNLSTGNMTKLSTLPGAEIEASAIAISLGVDALIGSAASEQVIKDRINDASIVHLATHGLLEYGNPEDTGISDSPGAIALAPNLPEQDGFLTSAEILNELNLTADLVVLSACDTGRGNITGDGVIGLARSFIAAGTPSVLVSLWAVPDSPTADLMTEFYAQMKYGQNKVQALRQAMLITMKSHPDPRDWAAFTLIGEAD
ncbi:MAG: CHAT domain-containing tetratricopeptide repeat protein [Cyanobacteria bacterium J06623_4]